MVDARPESDRPDAPDAAETDGSRSLVVGSFRRAFGATDSWLLRSYAVVAALVGGLLVLFGLLALPVWVLNTAGGSELATFSRAFLVVVILVVLVPVLLPVISAARRHECGTSSVRTDRLSALSGYVFVGSLYVALLVSAPPGQRGTPPALVAPAVEFLYGLPATYAVAPPVVGAGLVFAVHRLAR